MWWLWVAGGVGAWLLWRAASSDTTRKEIPAEPVVKPGMRIVLVGDSLGVGLAGPLSNLAQADGVSLSSRVRKSTKISYWSGQSFSEADLYLVSLGTNDALLADPNSEKDDLVQLLSKLGPNVAWIEPAPSPKTPRLDEVMDMVAELGVSIVSPPPGGYERGSDQIHATGKGYADWAQYVWKMLKGSQ